MLSVYPFGNFLTNGNSYNVLVSPDTDCVNGSFQPFSVGKQEISFYDRSGIVLRKDGSLSLSPLWKDGEAYNLTLTCETNGQNWAIQRGTSFSLMFPEGDHKVIGYSC
eukprot:gene3612-4139_t